jgi:hypothetical protein
MLSVDWLRANLWDSIVRHHVVPQSARCRVAAADEGAEEGITRIAQPGSSAAHNVACNDGRGTGPFPGTASPSR